MDTTALEAKITSLQAAIANDETTLANDQSELALAQKELAQATLINSLEVLTADEVATINAALAADGSPVIISLPSAAAPQE
jgi:hypothetical protein